MARTKRSNRSSRSSGKSNRSTKRTTSKRASTKRASSTGRKSRTSSGRSTTAKSRSGRKAAPRKTRGTRAARRGRPAGGRVAKRPKYSKWIESPDEHEDRQGQSLATRNHDVIRQWAEERQAVPSTVESTERNGRPGVLRLNFPGYGGDRLKEVSWDDWFATFDQRRLVFIYQEHKTDGATSNFFRLDNQEREDA